MCSEITILEVLSHLPWANELTHWGRVMHICVSNLTFIGSDNSLSPGRRQAIIWTNAGILSIGPLATKFSEILAEIITFSFKKMYLKVSSAKWRPLCLGLNVLKCNGIWAHHIFYNDCSYIGADYCCHSHEIIPHIMQLPWWGPNIHGYLRRTIFSNSFIWIKHLDFDSNIILSSSPMAHWQYQLRHWIEASLIPTDCQN